MQFIYTLFSFLLVGLSACGMIQRHSDSGYAKSLDGRDGPMNPEDGFSSSKLSSSKGSNARSDKRLAKITIPSSDDVQSAIDSSDIILGMTRENVQESWGRPKQIETSGSRKLGNERWLYNDSVGTPDGYKSRIKIVVFSNGRVSGWRTQN